LSHHLVELDGLAIEKPGDIRRDRRLPRAHESDQSDVAVERVQRHSMRAR